ncbi:MAG: hypothetical protein AB7O37_22730 [Vicinamibacteria bacterium]
MSRARFAEILQLLAAGDVEFVVVGMAAGILQGAPVTTLDLDIVHRRTPENVVRLLQILASLDAVYRHDARRLRPRASHLEGPGHQFLTTTHGDLDCLGAIDDGRVYEDLLAQAAELRLASGLTIRVLGLAALVEIKQRLGRPKDLAALPVLRATLDEATRRS